VLIRSATAEDIEPVVALVESAYRGDSSRAGWTTEADLLDGRRTGPDEVSQQLANLLLAVDRDEIVGCCVLEPRQGYGHFGMFAVRPGLQGAGVGSALLTAAEQCAQQLGLKRVEMTVLAVRTELVAYYLRRGYAEVGETRPFPYGDERFGIPQRDDLVFTVLTKAV
jgi:N-acetylglutamate synthase-like GNAT family acetyltransferase